MSEWQSRSLGPQVLSYVRSDETMNKTHTLPYPLPHSPLARITSVDFCWPLATHQVMHQRSGRDKDRRISTRSPSTAETCSLPLSEVLMPRGVWGSKVPWRSRNKVYRVGWGVCEKLAGPRRPHFCSPAGCLCIPLRDCAEMARIPTPVPALPD